MKRRNFLINTTLTSVGTLFAADAFSNMLMPLKASGIRFGICTDIHLDTVYDGKQRLEAYMADMVKKNPDFIIQLGDFCSPHEQNKAYRDIWNRFKGPKYDVIGNHDTDEGFTRQQVVDFWKMPARYYSFDSQGYHFVVLDANEAEQYKERDPKAKYVSYIGDDQLAWLEADLDKTKSPVIVFLHQSLENNMGGVQNGVQVRALLDRCNVKAKALKVQMVFTGHHHQDYYNVINGIHYIQINSMSYQWMGKGYENVPYTEAVNEKYTWTKYTAPYKDPLWAFVEISPNGKFKLTGRQSVFAGKSPEELGRGKYNRNGYPDVPYISNREIKLLV